MMNVLEVPARVVGGYLGGEHNPYGNYLTIRQSYAHAWVEIFDPKNGWTRALLTLQKFLIKKGRIYKQLS